MNPPTTQDPALTKPTFSNNCTLTAALQRIAARHSTNPAPVISGAETDGIDATPEPPSYDPDAPMCQDDYEFFTQTGIYANGETPLGDETYGGE